MSESTEHPPYPALPEHLRAVGRLGGSPLSDVLLVEVLPEGELRALKVLRASAARDGRLRERWQREADLLADLRHPQLLAGFGSLEVEERPAVLLEYVDGPSLRDRLDDGPMAWEEAARIGIQVARALTTLHRRGVYHRDVKPHNILLHPERGAVLADLGLVRLPDDPGLTRHGAALGSPAYMPPEQAKDPSSADGLSDLFSLGATLHHLVSGAPPFRGRGVGEVLHRVLHEPPEPLPAHLPPGFRKVVATCMAKVRADRYDLARAVAKDLGRVLLDRRPLCLTAAKRQQRTRRRVGAGVLMAAAVLLTLARGGFFDGLFRSTEPSPPSPVVAAPDLPPAPGAELDPTPAPEATEPPTLEFSVWARSMEPSLAARLSAGNYRELLAELERLSADDRFSDADPADAQSHRSFLARWREEVLLAANTQAQEAGRILNQEVDRRRALGADSAVGWPDRVRRAWRDAGLHLQDLPIRSGGIDPAARLLALHEQLLQEEEERQVAESAAALPPLRHETERLLLDGRFAAAAVLWRGVDSNLLASDPDAARDAHRVAALAALDRQLGVHAREVAGVPGRLALRNLVLEGSFVGEEGPTGWLFTTPGRTLSLGILDFEPQELTGLLELGASAEVVWLEAHLLHLQKRGPHAEARMEVLLSQSLPARFAPRLWIEEWRDSAESGAPDPAGIAAQRQELLRQASLWADRGEPEEALHLFDAASELGGDRSTADTRAARRSLIRRAERAVQRALWQKQAPDGVVALAGDDAIRIEWLDIDLSSPWRRALPWDRKDWPLQRWEVAWTTPVDAGSMRLELPWGVRLEGNSRAQTARVHLGDRAIDGLGLVPGTEQRLSWESGSIYLDGILVGLFPHPRERRLNPEVASAGIARLQSLVLTLEQAKD